MNTQYTNADRVAGIGILLIVFGALWLLVAISIPGTILAIGLALVAGSFLLRTDEGTVRSGVREERTECLDARTDVADDGGSGKRSERDGG